MTRNEMNRPRNQGESAMIPGDSKNKVLGASHALPHGVGGLIPQGFGARLPHGPLSEILGSFFVQKFWASVGGLYLDQFEGRYRLAGQHVYPQNSENFFFNRRKQCLRAARAQSMAITWAYCRSLMPRTTCLRSMAAICSRLVISTCHCFAMATLGCCHSASSRASDRQRGGGINCCQYPGLGPVGAFDRRIAKLNTKSPGRRGAPKSLQRNESLTAVVSLAYFFSGSSKFDCSCGNQTNQRANNTGSYSRRDKSFDRIIFQATIRR
jgi:hypothetical protein